MTEKIGAMYGNLRAENILLKLNEAKNKVECVKFLNFGYLLQIDNLENMRIPD